MQIIKFHKQAIIFDRREVEILRNCLSFCMRCLKEDPNKKQIIGEGHDDIDIMLNCLDHYEIKNKRDFVAIMKRKLEKELKKCQKKVANTRKSPLKSG